MAAVRPLKARGKVVAGHWRVQVSLGRDIEGKRTFKSVTICPPGCAELAHSGFPRHEGSKRSRDRLVAELEDRLKAESGPVITVSQLIAKWIEQGDHADSTRYGYRSSVKLRIGPTLGDRPIHTLRTMDVAGYRDHFKKTLAPATVNQDLAVLRGAFRFAVEQGWLDASPVVVRRAKQGASVTVMPTLGPIRAVLGHLWEQNQTLGMAMWLGLCTGGRRSEVMALRWADIDLEDGMLTFAHSLNDRRLKDTKTHQIRHLPLVGESLTGLVAWKAKTEQRLGVRVSPDWFVFASSAGPDQPMHPDSLSTAIFRIRRAHEDRTTPCPDCGMTVIPRVWMHGLRHVAASEMLGSGVDPTTVAAMLGHSTVATTLAVYAHGTKDRMRAAAQIAGSTLALPGTG